MIDVNCHVEGAMMDKTTSVTLMESGGGIFVWRSHDEPGTWLDRESQNMIEGVRRAEDEEWFMTTDEALDQARAWLRNDLDYVPAGPTLAVKRAKEAHTG